MCASGKNISVWNEKQFLFNSLIVVLNDALIKYSFSPWKQNLNLNTIYETGESPTGHTTDNTDQVNRLLTIIQIHLIRFIWKCLINLQDFTC